MIAFQKLKHIRKSEEIFMRRINLTLITLFALCFGFAQSTLAAGMWEKGTHYQELPFPMKTRDASKIEVVEMFWYGCPHCYEFNNDHLPEWEENLPDDVDFVMVPATFPNWVIHAKAFFAAEALGVVKKVHQDLFDAIVANPKKFDDTDDFKSIFLKHGVSEDAYDKVFEASGFRKISKVDEAVKKAGDRARAYRLTGVPALVVNGKYMVGVREAGSFGNMLKIVNYLVNEERIAKNSAAK